VWAVVDWLRGKVQWSAVVYNVTNFDCCRRGKISCLAETALFLMNVVTWMLY
jgi:hypothetical protein